MLGLGKWALAGVPHRGWSCVGIEDLGEPAAICEMCERQEIRYVHYMTHADYPELACGCICAGHMEEDLAGAKTREIWMKAAADRRGRWLFRKGWRRTHKGNLMIRTNGYRIVVFAKDGGWGGCIEHVPTIRTVWARRTYPTCDAARLAAFDAMTFMERRQ